MNSAQKTCEVARIILERAANQPNVTLAHICVAVGEAIGVLRVESVGGPPQGTPQGTPAPPAPTYDASSEDYSRGFNECRALDRQSLESVFDSIGGVASFTQQYRMPGGFKMWLDAVLPLEEADEDDETEDEEE